MTSMMPKTRRSLAAILALGIAVSAAVVIIIIISPPSSLSTDETD